MTGESSLADRSNLLVQGLIDRARSGDEAAREQLFQKCRSYLGVVARSQVESWLQSKVDASDLVQQTMLEAHRGFADFRGQTAIEWLAWVRRILTHNAADFVRQYRGTDKRQARREVRIGRPGDSDAARGVLEPCDPGEGPSALILRHERELLVADALTRLALDHQEVIALRNLERLPFEEIARRMGRSGPAVQMLWMRALKSLHKLLEQDLAGEAAGHE
jgi:RNA polymerase sigma-70 factor (ECF subfamily)